MAQKPAKQRSEPWEGEDARGRPSGLHVPETGLDHRGTPSGLTSAILLKHSVDSQVLEEAEGKSDQERKSEDNHLSGPSISTSPSQEKPAVEGQEDNDGSCTPSRRKKFVQNENEVEVQQNDLSSPLHSVRSFEELPLSEQLHLAVIYMGFYKPSKIQETALLMLLADPPFNLIVQSQSGTGKTAASVLSMLSRVDAAKNFPQVICLLPTPKLALQTGQVAEMMGKFCPEVKIGYAVMGRKVPRGQKVQDHILFGTPGIVLNWIKQHHVDPSTVNMLVLDEADDMIALQAYRDQRSLRVRKTVPRDCHVLLLCITCDEEVMGFARKFVADPLIIQQRPEEENLDNIKQFYEVCRDIEDKFQALSNLYGVVLIELCIIFCNTPTAASLLAQRMTEDGHAVALLSGEITVKQRRDVLDRFREGKEKLLITTVRLRGKDVEQVTVVVNYDMPPDFETYLHRIGRTGRFGKSGIAVNFIDSQQSMAIMERTEEHFGNTILRLKTNDLDALEKLNEDTFSSDTSDT